MNKRAHFWHPGLILLLIFLLVLSSCNLPGVAPTTPTSPSPTPYDMPAVPPALVETDPVSGSLIGLQQVLTFYFNQPMQAATVEKSLAGQLLVTGKFNWLNDSTVQFIPLASYAEDASLTLNFDDSQLAANGQGFGPAAQVTFTTSPALTMVQSLPEKDATDVSSSAAIVAAFNQPVVPLGADPAGLPAGLTLQPAADGHGEWLNTSTYIFYPDPGLSGGIQYTATLNSQLTGTSGASLSGANTSWSFSVSLPKLVSMLPDPDSLLPLDSPIKLTFNMPMDPTSVESAFSLVGPSGNVAGGFSWNANQTILTFTPSARLQRTSSYTLTVSTQAQARGGTPLPEAIQEVFQTYPAFKVTYTEPYDTGTTRSQYDNLVVHFSVPLQADDLTSLVGIQPAVSNFSTYHSEDSLYINGSFQADTIYTVTIKGSLQDAYGSPLGHDLVTHFRTPASTPGMTLLYLGSELYFTRAFQPTFYIQATNVPSVDLSLAPVPFDQFLNLFGPNSYDARNKWNPAPATVTSWKETINSISNQSQQVGLDLGGGLTPGIYALTLGAPQLSHGGSYGREKAFLVASNINMTIKVGEKDALLWAVDMRDGSPVANAPLSIYRDDGTLLASGQTDADGLWHGDIPPANKDQLYANYYAVLGQPGDQNFGMALTNWNQEISSYNFNIDTTRPSQDPMVYFYTDRPIYRPGQTVYFRAVVKQPYDGRYSAAGLEKLDFTINDSNGTSWKYDLPISAYGTVSGELALPDSAAPGDYTVFSDSISNFYGYFTVGNYRKPEINLAVTLSPSEVKADQSLTADISARYFFDAPVSGLSLDWTLYSTPGSFSIPGYQVGEYFTNWYSPNQGVFGETLKQGQAVTDANGKVTLTLTDLPPIQDLRDLTLEVTASDESGQPVSSRGTARRHPSDMYIGLRPDLWVGQSGSPMGFDVLAVDWNQVPQARRTLQASFQQVTWKQQVTNDPYMIYPTYIPVYTPVATDQVTTGSDGKGRLTFTAPNPGTFMLEVSGAGVHSQLLLWVGGQESAAWPNLAYNQLSLASDQKNYKPGQTAVVFISNPLNQAAQALVTVERGSIHSAQVVRVAAGGSNFSLPLSDQDAPNVIVSVTLLAGQEFRQGYINLAVAPLAETLNVELTSTPTRSEPGGEVNFDLRVTDAKKQPVQAEFSLAVVDEAVLALMNPNSLDILPAFYGNQPLAVLTGISLAADSSRGINMAGGRGGGGGGSPITDIARSNFPDTAFWSATIVTDQNGKAHVSLKLPDNLTTWQVQVRGLTRDTLVGQATLQLVSTKLLMVRPVTPSFLVVGDHVQVGAVVHNNASDKLSLTVSLQPTNFTLDGSSPASQVVDVPSGGRTLVTWWGTAGPADSTDLLFSASGGGLQDASHPTMGPLPVLHYLAPRTFSTAGILPNATTRLEALSLPRSFEPEGGSLNVELAPSLAAVLLGSLQAMPVPPSQASNEELLSYFLPNLEVYLSLKAAGLNDPDLTATYESRLGDVLQRLLRGRNTDGGWSWWASSAVVWENNDTSDPWLTAYILAGLSRASEAGFSVKENIINGARDFLNNSRPYLGGGNLGDWQLDLLSYEAWALQLTGGVDAAVLDVLVGNVEQLSPWAQATLALTLDIANHQDERVTSLLTNLASTAIRSASGAHWESAARGWHNPASTLVTTAMVTYALAQKDPASPLLADAVRYLSTQQAAAGGWGSRYETAWVTRALNAFMVGTGGYTANFSFKAELNGAPLASGQAQGATSLGQVTATSGLEKLNTSGLNALIISRDAGSGSLYYRAALQVLQPVEAVQPLDQGMQLSRAYFNGSCQKVCPAIHEVSLAKDGRITVRLSLNLPHDAYYLELQDYIPAGTQILDTSLKTSQQGQGSGLDVTTTFDPADPYGHGWGWWYFAAPRIYDDHIQWSADFVPAGSYQLSYTLIPVQVGQFRVIPAHGWQAFFPEVQGTSAGEVFEVKP